MPISVQLDKFFQRAQRTKGYQDRRQDSASRPFLATGLSTNNQALDEAINAAVAAAGDVHHVDSTLELAAATARRIGPSKAMGFLQYGRGPASTPVRAADETVTRSGSSRSVTWWKDNSVQDADGRPYGPFQFHPYLNSSPATAREPMSWTWRHSITTFTMRTVLNSYVNIAYYNLVGTINTNNFSQALAVGGFPPYSLYLAGIEQQAIDTPAGVRWPTAYTFIYNPHKWYRMKPPYHDGVNWVAALELEFLATTFPTFPVHA